MTLRRMALAVAVSVVGAPAAAYVRSTTGPPESLCLWWGKRQIPYVVNAGGTGIAQGCDNSSQPSETTQLVEASFATWAAVGCTDVTPVFGGTAASTVTGYDKNGANTNLVIWRVGACAAKVSPTDPCWAAHTCANVHDCWDHDTAGTLALTTTTFNTGTGEIVDADMELNGWDGSTGSAAGWYFTCTDPASVVGCIPAAPHTCACKQDGQTSPACVGIDVQNTVTHEAGHVLGLAHTPVASATMYFQAPVGETSKRDLDPDDIAGVCAIYPKAQPTATCVRSGCGCGTGGAGGLLALVPVLLWRRARFSIRRFPRSRSRTGSRSAFRTRRSESATARPPPHTRPRSPCPR